jgi:hypothetical protein
MLENTPPHEKRAEYLKLYGQNYEKRGKVNGANQMWNGALYLWRRGKIPGKHGLWRGKDIISREGEGAGRAPTAHTKTWILDFLLILLINLSEKNHSVKLFPPVCPGWPRRQLQQPKIIYNVRTKGKITKLNTKQKYISDARHWSMHIRDGTTGR